MIREFNIEDKEQLVKIVKQGIVIKEEDINYINGKNIKIIVYDDNETGLLGFSSFKIWGKHNADVYTYVVPSSRRKGIGTQLYNEIMKNVDDINIEFVNTRIKVDKDDATSFYKRLGYENWYVDLNLYYHGPKQPKSDLKFVPYEDKYFKQYADGLRTSFYELRKTNDFQPYLCCELNGEKRKEFLDNKDNLFLLLDNEKLIASVIVYNNGIIDDVYVLPSYQGKGYGKKTMQFAINKTIENGSSHTSLGAIDWNIRALNLYQSLGFDIVQTTQCYRLFKV
ncbi:GNAT family N-acetyltransferase (plasmid) [Clostridium estertheticum]|uniref:GNAT family N-acetyltransferase n=1 Tax=Clostridium estertheticum TaxID=238834 RepID=UPI001C0E13F8|nr:GNAT family N-acetyltransferase [Clostridium estertheticum]MBU3201800.1 GNAT family N-acetyltransferase [Clostridium estertheticum]WAG68193.1 GNAT family N-acetyltransferase [Clostridium estertheticum]